MMLYWTTLVQPSSTWLTKTSRSPKRCSLDTCSPGQYGCCDLTPGQLCFMARSDRLTVIHWWCQAWRKAEHHNPVLSRQRSSPIVQCQCVQIHNLHSPHTLTSYLITSFTLFPFLALSHECKKDRAKDKICMSFLTPPGCIITFGGAQKTTSDATRWCNMPCYFSALSCLNRLDKRRITKQRWILGFVQVYSRRNKIFFFFSWCHDLTTTC